MVSTLAVHAVLLLEFHWGQLPLCGGQALGPGTLGDPKKKHVEWVTP